MKRDRLKKENLLKTFGTLSMVILVWLLISNDLKSYPWLKTLILGLLGVIGIIYFYNSYKRDKEEELGLATEDELSRLLKYKSGYYAYTWSMYVWFCIFIFKDYFPNIETMIGGGILLSALLSFIAKVLVRIQLNEK
ncbi:hypothetical protein [Carboxylicivirga sp. M1479]|uniref:hypothetical protein n=1 Tax=Carboxylicivirga sp. M1479 TaxID=2594476 RepID=UPI001177F4BE|nr:hypothetical protein [Carboxylicivirga sp. M1479]TRX71356.1 hypothetical protein FNN09_07125 [Carboxylicivirga sp. M1479]